MRTIIIAAAAVIALAGCASTPDGEQRHQLSETGKAAIQATAQIAARNYLRNHPGRATEIAANIRAAAAELRNATSYATVSALRVAVELELTKRIGNEWDLEDAKSLLDVFEPLLREQIGKNEIDSEALVRINDFADMIVRALPAV